ncbi:MAG: flagellar hook-length control protein FliK [Vulcanimicrobiaceae bacterium]
MSASDPGSGLAAQAVAAAQNAIADATLQLGTAAILRADLQVGQVLDALVLPPQGGSDRVQILGQTVVAQLPPGIDPGQTLALQITGFSGNRILVHNLGPTEVANPPLPPSELPSSGPRAALLTTPAPPSPTPPASWAPVTSPIAPSREVFVAASVRPPIAGAPPPVGTPSASAGTPSASASPSPAAGGSAPSSPPGAAAAPSPAVAVPASGALSIETSAVEARIAAARLLGGDLLQGPLPSDAASLPEASSAGSGAAPSGIATPTPATPTAGAAPSPAAQMPIGTTPLSAELIQNAQAPDPAVILGSAQRLLAQLGIPATPTTLAAARIVSDAAAAVPRALASLESALAQVPAEAPYAAPAQALRALIGFIAQLDPGNAHAFPEQIAAYVENVLSGSEPKLAALLQALRDGVSAPPVTQRGAPAQQSAQAATSEAGARSPSTPQAPGLPATPAGLPNAAAASTPAMLAAQAHAVERNVAMQYDPKSLLLSMLRSPALAASPILARAVNDAVVALTAAQLGSLAAQNNDPSAITLALPVFFHPEGRPTQIRISREAPRRGTRLDAENFHVAFVLDTARMGTVGVELRSTGRAVSVEVRTERPSFADRFRAALPQLRSRFEEMRYRVAAMSAGVLRTPESAQPQPEAPPSAESSTHLDVQA